MTSHRRDLVSLFFGLVFALCGVAFLDRSEGWDLFDSVGILALGLVSIGVLGVLLVLTGARRDPTVEEPPMPSVDTSPDDADLDLSGFDDPYGADDPDDQFDGASSEGDAPT